MITKIKVNGFKSLRDFELHLMQGLNILVGPNGAGKTNIIIFFEFLSNLTTHQVGNAISNVGGAGAIFQKKGDDSYHDTIEATICGCSRISRSKFLVYEYSFAIKISFEKDIVFYSQQEIKFRHSTKFWENPDSTNFRKKWDLHVNFKISSDEKPDLEIIKFVQNKIETRYFEFSSQKEFQSALKSFILNQNPSYFSIIRCMDFFMETSLSHILVDLKGGETFNVIPSKVRELEDSATPPVIKKDGSGLATTLYAMKKSKDSSFRNRERMWLTHSQVERPIRYNPEILDKIISFLKAANSTIEKLDVENDPFNNKLRVKVKIRSGDYDGVLPLAAMSDGTIKWLTLITAIFTSKTIFSIEEPENFLHPWMQAEIAMIMRNHLQEKGTEAFVLMTTHSESLLNHAKPEEIIVVDLTNGRTKARRLQHVQAIKDEIANSGFGLGHFYFSNALSNE